jgi:acylphosphatase
LPANLRLIPEHEHEKELKKALRRRSGMWLHDGRFEGRSNQAPGMERKRLHIYYSGRVQGVGFRYTVKSLAQGFELTGAVRNLADGRVELLAEGADSELKEFQQSIKDSELGPFIKQQEVHWEVPKNEFRGFEIVR